MSKAERYIQLHKELWDAFCDRKTGLMKAWFISDTHHAKSFLHWLHNHSGIYQPACREYLDILGGMKA